MTSFQPPSPLPTTLFSGAAGWFRLLRNNRDHKPSVPQHVPQSTLPTWESTHCHSHWLWFPLVWLQRSHRGLFHRSVWATTVKHGLLLPVSSPSNCSSFCLYTDYSFSLNALPLAHPWLDAAHSFGLSSIANDHRNLRRAPKPGSFPLQLHSAIAHRPVLASDAYYHIGTQCLTGLFVCVSFILPV